MANRHDVYLWEMGKHPIPKSVEASVASVARMEYGTNICQNNSLSS